MLDPQLQQKVSQAYAKLGDISFDLAKGLRNGKDYTDKQINLWDRGIRLMFFLELILENVDFSSTAPPVLIKEVTEKQINSWTRCLDRIGELNEYPIVPLITNNLKPVIVLTGTQGIQGLPGADGDDADIIVEAAIGEDQITVTEQVVSGIKHYQLTFTPYVAPAVSVGIQGTKVFQKGTVQNLNVDISTTKGREDITALTCLTPASLNTTLQGLINLLTLNGGAQPVLTTLPNTGVVDTRTYSIEITDGNTPDTDSDTVSFYFPYLYGNSAVTSFNRYTALNKLIAGKATREITFNGINVYFYIGFPSSYGTLQRILDDNGFNVIGAFETFTENVTSSGLTNNWTEEYRFYKTIAKTTINNKAFTIEFP